MITKMPPINSRFPGLYPDSNFGSRVIQVIETIHIVGKATEADPTRQIALYHSLDGKLLAVYDPKCDLYGLQSEGELV